MSRRQLLRNVACAAVLSAATAAAGVAAQQSQVPTAPVQVEEGNHIPFVRGLTVVRATSAERGDYEIIARVDAISKAGYRLNVSGEFPKNDGNGRIDTTVARRVRAQDQLDARKLRMTFATGDAEQFSGTVPGFSSVMVRELRATGRTAVTYLDIGNVGGMSLVTHAMSGTMVRVPDAPKRMQVLVNGRRIALPVIHAKGNLQTGSFTTPFEFIVLDDPDNPIVIQRSGYNIKSKVVKIDYPLPPDSRDSLEMQLATDRKADVYGIYFAFASATLRPQSEPVLREIASALRQHPDWTLRIDGHTDGIGDDAHNLDLSRRRAAAVKTALTGQYGIAATRLTTSGHGERKPKGSNETPEGRALNRRVELTRP